MGLDRAERDMRNLEINGKMEKVIESPEELWVRIGIRNCYNLI